jgi:hypothetical protein
MSDKLSRSLDRLIVPDTGVITPPGPTLDGRVGGPIERAAGRRFRLWPRRSWQLRLGSRRAATGVRNDRGARPKTVEDHDRRFSRRWQLTWRFPRALTVLNSTEFHG